MQSTTSPGRLARRWVRQHYHPAFGYGTHVTIHRKRGSENWTGNPLAMFGKVAEVKTDKPDVPLVWDAEEAVALLEKGERIGYVYADKGGYLHVGIAAGLTPPIDDDWRTRVRRIVQPAAPAIRNKELTAYED